MLASAGHDVQVAAFDGEHSVPPEPTVRTIIEALGA
jgi:hypothetical protein